MDFQGYADDILQFANRLYLVEDDIIKSVGKDLVALQKKSVSIIASGEYNTQKELLEIKKELRSVSGEYYDKIEKTLLSSSESVASTAFVVEKKAQSIISEKVAKIKITPEQAVKKSLDRVMPDPRGQSLTVGEVVERFSKNGKNSILNIATRGYQQGQSITKMVDEVKVATGLQKNAAESVTRTVVMAASNEARDHVAKSLGSEKTIWMATLDSKSCPFCQAQDGKCSSKGVYSPPAHPRCRCVLLYLPLGTSCSEIKEDLTRQEKGEDGVSRETKYQSYGQWIQTQDKSFQQEVLGRKRASLLEKKEVTFDKMYTGIGVRKTVSDLEKQYL